MGTAAPDFPRSHRVPHWHAAAAAIARSPAAAGRAALADAPAYPGLVKAAIVVGASLALWAAIAGAVLLALG